jgi:hypothetical protein
MRAGLSIDGYIVVQLHSWQAQKTVRIGTISYGGMTLTGRDFLILLKNSKGEIKMKTLTKKSKLFTGVEHEGICFLPKDVIYNDNKVAYTLYEWSVHLFWKIPLNKRTYGQFACSELRSTAVSSSEDEARKECERILKTLGIKRRKR